MKKLDSQQFKPSQIGLTTGSAEGGRTREYLFISTDLNTAWTPPPPRAQIL